MNKKQFLWLLAALVLFVGVGWLGIRTAQESREQAASAVSAAEETISSMMTGLEPIDYAPNEPYIAKVSVEGTIAAASAAAYPAIGYDHEGILAYIDELMDDENNIAMYLYIDSPGGEMAAGDELYLKLMEYKSVTGRPIYCYFDTQACSGGYYVAMAADEIQANRNCICVNIGVYITAYNLSGLYEKLGVEQVVFKSSENKGIGLEGVEWTDEQREIYQDIVDLYYDQFVEIVAAGRGMSKAQVRERDDGREMLASQALEAGFIDGICTQNEFESELTERLGVGIYEPTTEENGLFTLLRQYISSVMPRSDMQTLREFADMHSGIKVMAYAENGY